MRRSSCRSKSFEREAEGERKLNRAINKERENGGEKKQPRTYPAKLTRR